MTVQNLNPFANAFNTRKFGNFNVNKAESQSYIKIIKNPNDLTVPDSVISHDDIIKYQQQLTVPNQDIPYNSNIQSGNGFIGNSTLFKLSDGSIIDFKTKRVIRAAYDNSQYWNDPDSKIKDLNFDTNNSWEKTPAIEDLINSINKTSIQTNNELSEADIRYWQIAYNETKRLEQNLTDEQKQLLNDLNSGKIFPLSRLEDD